MINTKAKGESAKNSAFWHTDKHKQPNVNTKQSEKVWEDWGDKSVNAEVNEEDTKNKASWYTHEHKQSNRDTRQLEKV